MVTDMKFFSARRNLPADVCRREVEQADVYVLLAGFRYGSTVRDRPDRGLAALDSAVGLATLTMLRDGRPDRLEHYLRLAVFPEDVDIPLATLSRCWGMAEPEAERLSRELAELELVERVRSGAAGRAHRARGAGQRDRHQPRRVVAGVGRRRRHRAAVARAGPPWPRPELSERNATF